jgi:hypothetical protein
MDLPVKYKAFWFYICDQCDCAGVWEPNIRLAVAQIGENMELVEILRVFEKRIVQTDDGKLWVKSFIRFQYGLELNPANSAHLGVLKRLELNKISPPVRVIPSKNLKRATKAPFKDFARSLVGSKDKDKDTLPLHTPSLAPSPPEPSKEDIEHRKASAAQHLKELRDKLRAPP